MKLSNKDLLIILGIAVAVIITLTTWVYTDQTTTKAELTSQKIFLSPNIFPAAFVKNLILH